jgi:hypothetical protein
MPIESAAIRNAPEPSESEARNVFIYQTECARSNRFSGPVADELGKALAPCWGEQAFKTRLDDELEKKLIAAFASKELLPRVRQKG